MLVKTQHLLRLNGYKVSAFVASLLVVFALASCSDNDDITDNPNDASEAEEYVADPTDDQMEVTYGGKTAVLDYNFDDIGLAIFSRMVNRTGDITDDVDAVLLSPKALKSDFTVEEAVQLVKLYERGGTIIMVEPRDENWQQLGTVLEKAEAQMEADSTVTCDVHNLVDRWEMLKAQSGETQGFGNQDAVALRRNDIYIISDLSEQMDSNFVKTDTTQEVSAYRYGKSADLLMEWLKNGEANQARLAAGKQAAAVALSRASASSEATDLSDIADAQRVTCQFQTDKSKILGKSMTYEYEYEIYSLYNFEKDEDYYLIKQRVVYHGGQLGCTANEEKTWTALPTNQVYYTDKGRKYYYSSWNFHQDSNWSLWASHKTTFCAFGPYVARGLVNSRLEGLTGSETVNLMDPKPAAKIKNQTVTSGFSFSLSGVFSVGKSADKNVKLPLYGGIIPWVSWNTTTTVEEENLTISREYDNLSAQWTMEGIHPKDKTVSMTSTKHTTIAPFQYSDWSNDFTWYYRIEHPGKNREYKLSVRGSVNVGELLRTQHDDAEVQDTTWNWHRFYLTPPNRYKQHWVITCSDESLLASVRNQLSKTWSNTYISYAKSEKGLEENVIPIFNAIKSSVSDIAFNLVEQGFTGSYTFSISKEGSTEPFRTFTLNNGKVE